MKFGYARVSTIDQNLEIQINAIEEYGVDKIFSDKVTGKNMYRKDFMKLLDQLRAGDTLIVYSLSRLGRKTKDLIELIETLNNNSITLISLKENIDTNSPIGRAMIGMISIFSELERELIAERVREGVKNARARGRLGGRPRLNSDSVKEAITLYRTNQYSINEIIKKTGVSKTTLYRRLNEFEDENDY
ncbi:recombinase family protein (plasmid) [Clostridium perfringens]